MSARTTGPARRNWASERSNLQIRNIFWLLELAHVRTALAVSSRPQAAADLVRSAAPSAHIDAAGVLGAAEAGSPYDLVFLFDHDNECTAAGQPTSGSGSMDDLARMALRHMAPGGTLIIIEPNPAWYRHVFASLPRITAPLAEASPRLISRRLTRIGYSQAQVLLIDPEAAHPKTIVPARSVAVVAHLRSERDRSSGPALPAKLALALLGGAGLLYPARAIIARK